MKIREERLASNKRISQLSARISLVIDHCSTEGDYTYLEIFRALSDVTANYVNSAHHLECPGVESSND